ncbi:MAG: FAD-binding oxidoreductase [Inquilinus sp.]|nr:FAD-binding oxidoreductase [Inquilinus sp.]
MRWKSQTLTGWGRSSQATVEAARPERSADIATLLAEPAGHGLIAHGGGRSYGDVALNDGGRVLLTERLDRLVAFDPKSGELVCEPGVTFAELMRVFLPRGYAVPVTPGTAFATIGGAVATDVHGKNHDRAGGFGDQVAWLELVLASGETVRASPTERPELFAATIGGMGLTGIIVAICFRLVRVPSRSLQVEERRIGDLDGFFAAFDEVRDTATFSVGWIDALARGRRLGRGILETADHAEADTGPAAPDRAHRVPFDLPGMALNSVTVAAFNAAYYRRVPAAGRRSVMPAERFFYPLDAIEDWNRLYGRRGFYQFQCVIPEAGARDGIRLVLEAAAAARGASFLAVLKTLGGEGRGLLSFPLRGHTLAIDFPRRSGIEEFFEEFERIVLDHGGRVYAAKDALVSPEGFARMYPRLAEFRAILAEADPQGRFRSDLARRLGIVGERS